MFKLCHFINKPDVKFILYHDSDFSVEEFNMESELILTFTNMKFDLDVANHYAILSYNDLLIHTLNPRHNTDTDKLASIGIQCISDLDCENTLIQLKQSKLSRSQRELVQKRYNELCNS